MLIKKLKKNKKRLEEQINKIKRVVMKRTFLIIPIVLLASCFFYVRNLLAWSDKVTHPAITKIATETKSTLRDYLINNLGFKKGLGEKINISSDNSSVLALLQKGSQQEDEGTRAKNHFHNPLKATSSAGLDDWTYYPIIWHYTGNSNLAWAQGDISSNEYSWNKARAAFLHWFYSPAFICCQA